MRKAFTVLLTVAFCAAAFGGGRNDAGKPRAFSIDDVWVSAGTFSMGGTMYDGGKPIHQVTVKMFYMSDHEVTQKEWVEVMGSNPSYFEGDTLPVECVSWYDAIEYCNKRSVKEGLTPAYTVNGTNVTWDRNANGYRLPTEAEWEYAARGGSKSKGYEYSGSSSVDGVAWYNGNSGNKTHPVKTKSANELGLYDMSGNVYEWCWDWYDSYGSEAQTDPTGASSGTHRVFRGGSWYDVAAGVRSAFRNGSTPSNRGYILGFRLVRP
jgi:formylglycine-generating enzyme required for sulfatase activity